ncbi:MAG: hypothetical protein ACTHMU_26790 [Thermomicrobiales bacterium]
MQELGLLSAALPRRCHLACRGLATIRARAAHFAALVLEHAWLRRQVAILAGTANRPRLTALDRRLIVPLASQRRTWAQTLVIPVT